MAVIAAILLTVAPVCAQQSHDLSVDEAMGGHTLARHVGRTDAQLAERLRRERDITAASTYTDRPTAERTVAAALGDGDHGLAVWEHRAGHRPNFVIHYAAHRPIGRSLRRGQTTTVACTRAIVVLRWDERRHRSYVLTTYPEADR